MSNESLIPENLKLLKELKVIEETTPETFILTRAFLAIYKSNRYRVAPIKALNQAVNAYCPDLSKSESQQVKGTVVSLLAQSDPIFCREWIIERCMQGAKFSEIRNFITFVLKHNGNINED